MTILNDKQHAQEFSSSQGSGLICLILTIKLIHCLYRKQNENEHDHLAHVGSQKYYGKRSLVQWLSTQLCKFLRIAPNRDAF